MFQVFAFAASLWLSIMCTVRFTNEQVDGARRGHGSINNFDLFMMVGFFWAPTILSLVCLSTLLHESYFSYYH